MIGSTKMHINSRCKQGQGHLVRLNPNPCMHPLFVFFFLIYFCHFCLFIRIGQHIRQEQSGRERGGMGLGKVSEPGLELRMPKTQRCAAQEATGAYKYPLLISKSNQQSMHRTKFTPYMFSLSIMGYTQMYVTIRKICRYFIL